MVISRSIHIAAKWYSIVHIYHVSLLAVFCILIGMVVVWVHTFVETQTVHLTIDAFYCV